MRLMAINFAGRSRLAVCSFHPPPHSIPLSSILLCHFVSLFLSPIWSLSNSQLGRQATPKSRQHMLLKPLHMSESVFVQVCGFVSVCVCVCTCGCAYAYLKVVINKNPNTLSRNGHENMPAKASKWEWEGEEEAWKVCVWQGERESVRTAQSVAH